MAMYTQPVPTPFPMPIPIPVPCFIPTTKKSSEKILKQIKVRASLLYGYLETLLESLWCKIIFFSVHLSLSRTFLIAEYDIHVYCFWKFWASFGLWIKAASLIVVGNGIRKFWNCFKKENPLMHRFQYDIVNRIEKSNLSWFFKKLGTQKPADYLTKCTFIIELLSFLVIAIYTESSLTKGRDTKLIILYVYLF